MKFKLTFLISVMLIVAMGCSSSKKKARTINISGAFALYPMVVKWADLYKQSHPKVRFNISGGGAGKGMADALSGVADLGMFSREISPEELEKGVWWVGLCIDAVVPVISAENPYYEQIKKRGLTRDEFAAIFVTGTITNWHQVLNLKGNKGMEIYTRSDACGAAETWAQYLGAKQENIAGIGIFGDPGLAEAVIKAPYGIGYNNTAYVYDTKTGNKRPGIEVVPIDINGNGRIDPDEDFYDNFDSLLNAIANGVYPSPPARELYFVAQSKPKKKAVKQFLKWVLTDGQHFVHEAGYVPLSSEKIEHYLEKLK